jgi:O-antigen biosynthesis protein
MITGLLRIKNEAGWIERVLRAIQPVCERIIVLDDHSTDGTPEICRELGVELHMSRFSGIDESRDKDFLLTLAYEGMERRYRNGDHTSPHWALMVDGDEVLHDADQNLVRQLTMQPDIHAWAFRVLYLWDSEKQWRTDGVYGRFRRPSMFRLMNEAFRFQRTHFGLRVGRNGEECANFHCSSVPQEMLHHARHCEARLLHLGYMNREDRIRKWDWYNSVDPGNEAEDCYRHCVQGDVPEIPAFARLKHAGPLVLETL